MPDTQTAPNAWLRQALRCPIFARKMRADYYASLNLARSRRRISRNARKGSNARRDHIAHAKIAVALARQCRQGFLPLPG